MPTPADRARAVDLIVLPDGVKGTNCSNCQFVNKAVTHCDHPKVDLPVDARHCCALWDAPGTTRPEQGPARKKLRRAVLRYAKADTRHVAHPMVAGFPLETRLRRLANDPDNSADVRDLAKVALTGGEHGDATPMALWQLHDALMEHPNADGTTGHPALHWQNWMSAADKVQLDQHTHRALTEAAEDARRRYTGDPSWSRWGFSAEAHAHRAAAQLSTHPQVPFGRNAYDAELLTRVRQRVAELAPGTPEKDVDESIRRHALRAQRAFNDTHDLPTDTHDRRALMPHADIPEAMSDEGKANDLAARYRRAKLRRLLRPRRYATSALVKAAAPLHPVDMGSGGASDFGTLDALHHHHANMAKVYTDLASDLSTRGRDDVAQIADYLADEHRRHKAVVRLNMREHGHGWPRWAIATKGMPDPTDEQFAEGERVVQQIVSNIAAKNRPPQPTPARALLSRPRRYALQSGLRGFHGAFHDEPEDATHNAVYADWLQDQGHDALAAVVRGDDEREQFPVSTRSTGSHIANLQPGQFWGHLARHTGGNGEPLIAGHLYQRSAADPSQVFHWGSYIPREHAQVLADQIARANAPDRYRRRPRRYARDLHLRPLNAAVRTLGLGLASALRQANADPADPADRSALADRLTAGRGPYVSDGPRVNHLPLHPALPVAQLAAADAPRHAAEHYGGLIDRLHAEGKLPGSWHRRLSKMAAGLAEVPVAVPSVSEGVTSPPMVRRPDPGREAKPFARLSRREKLLRLRYAAPRRDFLDALRRVRSTQTRALHQVAGRVARQLGLEPTDTVPALHDGPGGSVSGVAMATYGHARPEDLHAAASWLGLTGRWPGAAVFHVRPNGPDALYKFRATGSGHNLRDQLTRAGVTSRVLVPHKGGWDVLVPDPGRRLGRAVSALARQHGSPVEASSGVMKVMGSADDAAARAKFRGAIERSERMARKGKPARKSAESNAVALKLKDLRQRRAVKAALRSAQHEKPPEELAGKLVAHLRKFGPSNRRQIILRGALTGRALDAAARHAQAAGTVGVEVRDARPASGPGGNRPGTWYSLREGV